MKKLVVIFNLAVVILSSCGTQKKGVSSYNDDVYANPKEDKIEDARVAAEKKLAKDAIDKRYNDSIAKVEKAQKEKDDANPYYKDREFKFDDYYDYEYATRVKRFDNNIQGLGYYDNYYTNSYWYNQNPYNYGVSVYNGYSWWGSSYNSYNYNPSVNFYSNNGWNCNNGFGYNGYNPYMGGNTQGYNNGFNYGLGYNFGYGNQFGYGNYGNINPYGYGGYGYNNGYSNYNNGWGYYNSHDNNSSYTYGPRTSHGGGNSRRTSNPSSPVKRESYVEKYIDAVTEQQVHTVKFTEAKNPEKNIIDEPIRVNSSGVPVGNGGIKNPPIRNTGEVTAPIRNNDEEIPPRGNIHPIIYNDVIEPVRNTPIRNNDNLIPVKEPVKNTPIREPIRNDSPIRNPVKTDTPIKQHNDVTPRFEAPVKQNNTYETPKVPNNNGGQNPPNNNSGHRPR